jgi:hypothetical protein
LCEVTGALPLHEVLRLFNGNGDFLAIRATQEHRNLALHVGAISREVRRRDAISLCRAIYKITQRGRCVRRLPSRGRRGHGACGEQLRGDEDDGEHNSGDEPVGGSFRAPKQACAASLSAHRTGHNREALLLRCFTSWWHLVHERRLLRQLVRHLSYPASPGGRYVIDEAFCSAASVSSTDSKTVV